MCELGWFYVYQEKWFEEEVDSASCPHYFSSFFEKETWNWWLKLIWAHKKNQHLLIDTTIFITNNVIVGFNFDVLNSSVKNSANVWKNVFEGADYQTKFLEEMKIFFFKLVILNQKGEDITSNMNFINCWQVTINGILKLWNTLKMSGFKYLKTRRVNQDCIENFFGCVRQQGGITLWTYNLKELSKNFSVGVISTIATQIVWMIWIFLLNELKQSEFDNNVQAVVPEQPIYSALTVGYITIVMRSYLFRMPSNIFVDI